MGPPTIGLRCGMSCLQSAANGSCRAPSGRESGHASPDVRSGHASPDVRSGHGRPQTGESSLGRPQTSGQVRRPQTLGQVRSGTSSGGGHRVQDAVERASSDIRSGQVRDVLRRRPPCPGCGGAGRPQTSGQVRSESLLRRRPPCPGCGGAGRPQTSGQVRSGTSSGGGHRVQDAVERGVLRRQVGSGQVRSGRSHSSGGGHRVQDAVERGISASD